MHSDLKDDSAAPATVVLLGQPNCGKTTLFNRLTGSHSRTSNYPGATVDFSLGELNQEFEWPAQVVDLPGLASLVPQSPDEEVTVRSLFGGAAHPAPDVAVVVADSTQLSRHLYLALQVRQTGIPMVVAVTMCDLLARRGRVLDPARLEERLGCPVVAIDGRSGTGVKELLDWAREAARTQPDHDRRPLGPLTADAVKASYAETELFEKSCISVSPEAAEQGGATQDHDVDPVTRRIDSVLLHPLLGLAAFVLIMGTIFTGIFWAAQPVMDLIDGLFGSLSGLLVDAAPESFLVRLLGDGIVKGAGGVVIFLPQIVILFFCMGLLEDSGYLARAAVLVDRPLSWVGLNGRSFVPLLSGFACAIPGMMAARTIPGRRERLLTLFIMPLMSCSARLPVYALLLAFLTPKDKPWIGGFGLALLYMASVTSGAVISGLVARMLPASSSSSFMLELPVYRIPQFKVIFRSTYLRSKHYLTKAGVPILVIATTLWLICNLPLTDTAGLDPDLAASRRLESSYAAMGGRALEPLMQPLGLDWRVGVALIGAFGARELFVGSLAIIFHVAGDDDTVQESLLQTMRTATLPDGSPLFTTASSLGLVVFFIFAMQCLSTAAVARKESGGWTMPLLQIFVFTGMAYLAAWFTVASLRALGVA